MKKLIYAIGLLLIAGLLWLFFPGNYYIRQALTHWYPAIDQYTIFDNRVVKALSPQPWLFADDYNSYAIAEEHLPAFDRLGTVAYLIVKDSAILFEQYWEGYSEQSYSNSFSMAKSIVSLAVGCAIDEGLIEGTEQPVADFFPEFRGYNGKVLTLHHLLTMSAGFDFDEGYSSLFSPTTQLYYGNDIVKQTLQTKVVEVPGVYFDYQSIVTQLLAMIVEKATGETVSDYVSRKLWTPMQAEEDALWSLDHTGGTEKAYCCFNSNARDFARFGQLLLNKGEWKGKQLISTGYLEKATQADTTLTNKQHKDINRQYGYQFWSLKYKELDIQYMRGILGQYVLVIPEKNAVIVRLGHKRYDAYTYQHYPIDINTWLEAGLQIIRESEKAAVN